MPCGSARGDRGLEPSRRFPFCRSSLFQSSSPPPIAWRKEQGRLVEAQVLALSPDHLCLSRAIFSVELGGTDARVRPCRDQVRARSAARADRASSRRKRHVGGGQASTRRIFSDGGGRPGSPSEGTRRPRSAYQTRKRSGHRAVCHRCQIAAERPPSFPRYSATQEILFSP